METREVQIARKSREIYLVDGFCCSESVLLAIAESKGIQSEWFPCIATGFCGGVSHTSGMCGSLIGAIMAIGLLTGRKKPSDPRIETFTMVQQLLQEFRERFGTANCTELLGCDLSTPEGLEYMRANNLRMRCADFVEVATEITARLLREK